MGTKIRLTEATFACYSKVCAPPPAGRGGSVKGRSAAKGIPSKRFGLWGAKNSKTEVSREYPTKRSKREDSDLADFFESGGKLSWKSGPLPQQASKIVNRARLRAMTK